MEGISSTPTRTGRRMVSRPSPYIPYLDPEVKIDRAGSMRDGLRADLKESISFYQTEIGLLSRIKEMAKDDPETLSLCRDIIQSELEIMKLTWEEINSLCE